MRCARIAFLSIAVAFPFFEATAAHGKDWAVWTHNATRPGKVTVAAPGTMPKPWESDGAVFRSAADAWKRACWLTRQGDIYGRRYASAEINANKVSCDANCNCSD